MRRRNSSKSDTCPESLYVYAAGISVKVGVHYPGRSAVLPRATTVERRWDEAAEVSGGHIKARRASRRPERVTTDRTRSFR